MSSFLAESNCNLCGVQITERDYEQDRYHVELFGGSQQDDDQVWVCMFCDSCKARHPVMEGGEA